MVKQSYYKNGDILRDTYSEVVKSTIDEILYYASLELQKTVSKLVVLDVGSGVGKYSFEMEKHVKEVVGVEPFKQVYLEAIKTKKEIKSKVKFINKLVEQFNTTKRFDLVISLTTIEHMPNAEESFRRIFSLMKRQGILYLTAPNRWWPFENHYKLFFLSWLPLSLANLYVRLFCKGSSYEDSAYSKSYFGMRKFLDKFPCKYEFILPRNTNAAFLGCGDKGKAYSIIKKLGIELIKISPFFWIFSKGFIVIVRKT